jgi:hypothetical protein
VVREITSDSKNNPIMKILLWVDDIRNAPDDRWTVARTINSAITALSTFEVEAVSLDHDISHQVVVGGLSRPYPCGECFCAVAHYMAEKYRDAVPEDIPIITIISANPVGARDMEMILKNEGGLSSTYVPAPNANRLESEI